MLQLQHGKKTGDHTSTGMCRGREARFLCIPDTHRDQVPLQKKVAPALAGSREGAPPSHSGPLAFWTSKSAKAVPSRRDPGISRMDCGGFFRIRDGCSSATDMTVSHQWRQNGYPLPLLTSA